MLKTFFSTPFENGDGDSNADTESFLSRFSPLHGSSNGGKIQISKDIETRFTDVIGLKNVKRDLLQYVNYIKNKDIYDKAGFKIPRGIIFTGPPGTGKTMLSKAIAGETKSTFIYTSGSDFIEMYVGVGARRVRKLFQKARENKPAIIFFDEIDAIGKKRSQQGNSSEHDSTLNQILEEMDGFKDNDGIMVIAATNMYNSLDSALKRSGRFDRKIVFDRPNIDEREKMLHMYLNKIKLDSEFIAKKPELIRQLAKLTSGATGADIANIANQAASHFVNRLLPIDIGEYVNTIEDFDEKDKDNKKVQDKSILETDRGATFDDIVKSIDEVTIGIEKKERLMSEKEKTIVAYHEAGHSLVAYLLKDTEPPIKVSIIPRGDAALGFSLQNPTDKKLQQYEELMARLCVLIGGRTAEKVVFNRISTGAYDDLQKMTHICYQIVAVYGMTKIGPINFAEMNNNRLSLDKLSDKQRENVDDEVLQIMSDVSEYTETILNKHYNHLEKIARHLLEHEEITTDTISELLGDSGIENSEEMIPLNENIVAQ